MHSAVQCAVVLSLSLSLYANCARFCRYPQGYDATKQKSELFICEEYCVRTWSRHGRAAVLKVVSLSLSVASLMLFAVAAVVAAL